MKFFQWIGKLFDDLLNWLGKSFSVWIQKLVTTIQSCWEEQIAPIIRYFFGVIKVIYVIFYRTAENIVNMEIWEPNSLQQGKQSQIIALEKAPTGVPIPLESQRNTSQVFKVENPLAPLTV